MKSAAVIRHVHFEDLGSFAGPLERAGYKIYYIDAGLCDLKTLDPAAADLLFVLGAPMGVYETAAYPFLADEISLLKMRLAKKLPLVGICLGAQLIAAALNAKVYPSGGKEIGYAPVTLTPAGHLSCLRHLNDVKVLHWHGDTFDLPPGSAHLAASALCPNQAFSLGKNTLAMQFHAEADGRRIESWLIGHAAELAGAKIDPRTVRADAAKYGPALQAAAEATMDEWLLGQER